VALVALVHSLQVRRRLWGTAEQQTGTQDAGSMAGAWVSTATLNLKMNAGIDSLAGW